MARRVVSGLLLVTLAGLVIGQHGGSTNEPSGAITVSGWHCYSVDAGYKGKLTNASPCLKVIHPMNGYAEILPLQDHFQFEIDVLARESERLLTQVEIEWFRVYRDNKDVDIRAIQQCQNFPICNVLIHRLDQGQTRFNYRVSVHYLGQNETASQDIVLEVTPKSSRGFASNLPSDSNFTPLGSSQIAHQKQKPLFVGQAPGINSQLPDPSGSFPFGVRQAIGQKPQRPMWNSGTAQAYDYGQDKQDIGFKNGNSPSVGWRSSETNLGPQVIPRNVQDGHLDPSLVGDVSLDDKPLKTQSAKQFVLNRAGQLANYGQHFLPASVRGGGTKSVKSYRSWNTPPPQFIEEATSDSDIVINNENSARLLNAINSLNKMLKYPEPTTQTAVDQHDFQTLSKGLGGMQKNVSKILKMLASSETQSRLQNPNTSEGGKSSDTSPRKVNGTLLKKLSEMADTYEDIQRYLKSLPSAVEDPPKTAQGDSKGKGGRNRVKRDVSNSIMSHDLPKTGSLVKGSKERPSGNSASPVVEKHFLQMWRELGLRNDDRDRNHHTKSSHVSNNNDVYQTFFGKDRDLESHKIKKYIEGKDLQTKFILTPEPDVIARQDLVLMQPTPVLETTSFTKSSEDQRAVFRHAEFEVFPILKSLNKTLTQPSKGSNSKRLPQTEPFHLHLQPFPEHSESDLQTTVMPVTYPPSLGVLSEATPLNDISSKPPEVVFEPSLPHSYDYEREEDDTDVLDDNFLVQPTHREGIFHPKQVRVEHSTQSPFAHNENFEFEVEEDNTDVLDYTTVEQNIFDESGNAPGVSFDLPITTTVATVSDRVYHRLDLNPETDEPHRVPFQIYENPFPNQQLTLQPTTSPNKYVIKKPPNKAKGDYIKLHIIPESLHLNSSQISGINSDSKLVNVSVNGMIKASNFKFLLEILDLLQDGEVSLPLLKDKKGNNIVVIYQEDYGIHFDDHNSKTDTASPGKSSMNIKKDGSSFLEKLWKYHYQPGKASDRQAGKHKIHIHINDVDGQHVNIQREAVSSKGNSDSGGMHHNKELHSANLKYSDESLNTDDDNDYERTESSNSEYAEDYEDGAGDGAGSYQYEVKSIPNKAEPETIGLARRNAGAEKAIQREHFQVLSITASHESHKTTPLMTKERKPLQATLNLTDILKKSEGTMVSNKNHQEVQLRKRREDNLLPTWSEWGAWSNCTVTCGRGVLVRRRYCQPEDTEKLCDGSDEDRRECVKEACLEDTSTEGEKVVKEEGHSTELECQYDKTKTVNKIHWLTPDGETVTTESAASSDKYKITGNKLIVRGVQKADSGTYNCVVTLEDGTSEKANAELEVLTCEPNPCLNGGTCIEYVKGSNVLFMCGCPMDYSGHTCEKRSSTGMMLVILTVIVIIAVAIVVIIIKKQELVGLIKCWQQTKTAHSGDTPTTVLEMDMVSVNKSKLTDAEINLFREISREEFKNFKTSNSYALFKGKSEKREPQAVLDIEKKDQAGTEVEDTLSMISDKGALSELSGVSSIKDTSLDVKTPTKKSPSEASVSLPPSPAPAVEKVNQQRSSHEALSDHGQSNLEDVLSFAKYQESKPRSVTSGSSTPKAKRSLLAPEEDTEPVQAILSKDEPSHESIIETEPVVQKSGTGPRIIKSSSGKLEAVSTESHNQERTSGMRESPTGIQASVSDGVKSSSGDNIQRIVSGKSGLSRASPSSQHSMLIAKEIVKVLSARALSVSNIQHNASSIGVEDSLPKPSSETKLQHVTGTSSYHNAIAHFSSTNTDAADKEDLDALPDSLSRLEEDEMVQDADQGSAVSQSWQPLQEFDGTEMDVVRTSTPVESNTFLSPSEENLSNWQPVKVQSDVGVGQEHEILNENQEVMVESDGIVKDHPDQTAAQKRRGSKFGYTPYVDRFTHLVEDPSGEAGTPLPTLPEASKDLSRHNHHDDDEDDLPFDDALDATSDQDNIGVE